MKWILACFLKEVRVYIIVKFELEVLCVCVCQSPYSFKQWGSMSMHGKIL